MSIVRDHQTGFIPEKHEEVLVPPSSIKVQPVEVVSTPEELKHLNFLCDESVKIRIMIADRLFSMDSGLLASYQGDIYPKIKEGLYIGEEAEPRIALLRLLTKFDPEEVRHFAAEIAFNLTNDSFEVRTEALKVIRYLGDSGIQFLPILKGCQYNLNEVGQSDRAALFSSELDQLVSDLEMRESHASILVPKVALVERFLFAMYKSKEPEYAKSHFKHAREATIEGSLGLRLLPMITFIIGISGESNPWAQQKAFLFGVVDLKLTKELQPLLRRQVERKASFVFKSDAYMILTGLDFSLFSNRVKFLKEETRGQISRYDENGSFPLTIVKSFKETIQHINRNVRMSQKDKRDFSVSCFNSLSELYDARSNTAVKKGIISAMYEAKWARDEVFEFYTELILSPKSSLTEKLTVLESLRKLHQAGKLGELADKDRSIKKLLGVLRLVGTDVDENSEELKQEAMSLRRDFQRSGDYGYEII